MSRSIALMLVLTICLAGQASADGFADRFRRLMGRGANPAVRSWDAPRYRYPTRNLDQQRTRLPSGRSYYQGRYYGNLGNRFYGPQYGYF